MESGSSGSFQSSSGGAGVGGGGGGGGGGGEEEYDSRGSESMSSFLNSHQQMFLSSYHQQNPPFFPPSSDNHSQNNFGASFVQNANFQEQYNSNNEQMGWSRGFLRSTETNYGNFVDFSTSSASSSTQPVIRRMINENPLSTSFLQSGGSGSGSGGGGEEAINNQTTAANQPPPPPPNVVGATKSTNNPKKRTRASRRAPTTVLTTDTTNFRQMVQEFTGIPAAPFSANSPGGSPFARRLDLFSSGGSAASSMRGGRHQLDHLSSIYPLRPSPQKLTHHSSLLGHTSSSSSLLSSSLIMNAIGNPNSNNASISNNTLGLPQHLKQSPPNQNLFTMQNQLLNFQPQVQSSLSPSSSIFNSATRPSHHHQGSSSMNIIPNSLDELGSFLNQQRSSEEVVRQSSWKDDQGGMNEGQDGQHQLGGTFESNNSGGFRLNSSSTSSDFNPEKALDNASSSGGVDRVPKF